MKNQTAIKQTKTTFIHFGTGNAVEFTQASTPQPNRTEANFIDIRSVLQVVELDCKIRSV